MSLVWAVPVVVLLVGAAAAVALVRATAESARELGQEIARFGELHVALTRVRAEIQQSNVHVSAIKGRSLRR
jgi:cytochrome c-type biogenesis protein CcmH/NrfF